MGNPSSGNVLWQLCLLEQKKQVDQNFRKAYTANFLFHDKRISMRIPEWSFLGKGVSFWKRALKVLAMAKPIESWKDEWPMQIYFLSLYVALLIPLILCFSSTLLPGKAKQREDIDLDQAEEILDGTFSPVDAEQPLTKGAWNAPGTGKKARPTRRKIWESRESVYIAPFFPRRGKKGMVSLIQL